MSMQKSMCPFCEEQKNRNISIVNKSRILAETDNFVVFPTTGGFVENYQLIVPKKHINCFGELLNKCKKYIDKKYNPDGYNVGLNCGESAGQSVMHIHMHLIPRYKGDVENPRGGVRGVIPNKKNY